MSKAGVNSSPMKQEMNPYKKDNRGPHSNSSNDKRNSDSFKSNNRDRDRSSRQDRSREEYDRRGAAHDDDEKTTEKTTESATTGEKKFTGRCRLFVGNLTPDISEADFRKLFEQYGEISEVYVNTSRGFGFIRLDYRQNAEAAKAGLDGTQRKGRILRVRFATHGAALKVKNLHSYVSNELLEQSFSQFGDLERCIVIVDDRGKSTGEGIVEFVRKPGANSALRRINEGVFLMGVDPKPVAVEPLEQKDEEDGMPEKFLTKTEQYKKEREKEPRFAPPGTFEYEFGMRWKQLEELEKQRIDQVKKDTEEARLKLEDEMQNALYEYQAEQIRQDLIRQQEELRRLEELRNTDRLRRQQEMEMRRQQQDAQQEERRRADMMMSMRQQDIARGRSGHMDGPGMRSREELMMAERFGDRMPERMNERMLDRMNDRMGGQGPPGGFNMWQEEKQRSEAMRNEQMRNEQMRNEQTRNEAMRGDANIRNEGNMRNEAGRGRDMRGPGPGASPNQPQGGAQSGMNNQERGGPPSSAPGQSNAGPAGPNVKSSPKPLMQGGPGGPGGNFGMGGPQNNNAGGGPNNMGNSGGDGGNMGDTNGNQEAPTMDDSCLTLSLEEETDERCSKTELDAPPPLSTSKHLINCEDETTDLSPPLPIGRETKEYWSAVPSRPPLTSSLDECRNGADKLVEESAIQSSCGVIEEAEKPMLPGGSPHRSIPEDSHADFCNDSEMLDEKTLNEESEEQESDVISKYTTEPEKYSYEKCLIDERECQVEEEQNSERSPLARNIPFSDLCDSMNVVTSGNSLSHRESSSIQSYITSNSSYSTSSPPAQTHLSSNAYQTITSPLRSGNSQDINLSSLNHGCESYQSVSNKSDCASSLETERIAHCIPSTSENTPVSYQTASPIQTSSYDIKSVTPSVLSDQKTDRDFEPPMSQLSSEFDSHQENVDSHYSPCDPEGVSSYKQRLFGESEEEMDEESSSQRKAISSDYQSYDGNVTVAPYVPLTQIQDNSQLQEVCFEDLSLNNEQVAMSEKSSSYISSDADGMLNSEANDNSYTSSEANDNSYTSAAVIDSVEVPTDVCEIVGTDNEVPVSVPSPPFVHNETVDNNEGALRTGDQNFKTTTSSSSQHASHSSSRASRVNAMPYTGATIVQGVKQPAMMSSSTVHIAQHQGATIMQHQSMTTGYPGGLAQATVVQKQALPNGMQTAMMQQRTITNGGQTMLVQQRTMTNVMGGGLAQQTVVQQRMVPGSVAQSAAMHAEALRQRALATQQATMMQQQAMRMAQVRVMGNPLLQAQAMQKPTVIQQAGPSGLLGPRLVQASAARGSVMQRLVRQRYMGSPVLPARGVQMISGRPVRVKLAYTRDALGFGSNT